MQISACYSRVDITKIRHTHVEKSARRNKRRRVDDTHRVLQSFRAKYQRIKKIKERLDSDKSYG